MLKYILLPLLILSVFMNYYLYIEGKKVEEECYSELSLLLENFTRINESLSEEIEYLRERVKSLEEREIVLDFPEGGILEDFIISNSEISVKNDLLRFYVYSQFVYGLFYVTEKEDFWNHPVKTFWDKKGDCDDRAILLCYLLMKYFEVYIISCEEHVFCAISYNCEEFNEKLNESLNEQGYYLERPMNCYRGNFKEIYVEDGVLRDRTRYFELVSPEEGSCEIKEIFKFKDFGIPRNTSLNLKDFFYPEISFDVEYSCLGDVCDGRVRIRNDGLLGLSIRVWGEKFEKRILLMGKDIKEVDFEVHDNWIWIESVLGKKRVDLE